MIEVVTREEARRRGLRRYFLSGCLHGHHDGRFTSNGACVGCHREAVKRTRKKWPETERALKKKINSRRVGKNAAYDRGRYERDGEKIRARVRKWQNDNPAKVRGHVRKRRAIMKGAVGSHATTDIDRIFVAQGGKCAYYQFCQTSLRAEYEVDHIIPLARGGTDSPNNLQLTCASCNMRKSIVHPLVFARRLGMLL